MAEGVRPWEKTTEAQRHEEEEEMLGRGACARKEKPQGRRGAEKRKKFRGGGVRARRGML